MQLTIADDILASARMFEAEPRCEVATLLYEREKLTLAQASRLAGMDRFDFQLLMASRGVPAHHGVEDFEQDLATLRTLGLP